MFKVKRIYDAPAEEDGFRVLVDRLWPRGLKRAEASMDLWMKEVAPSSELRKWFAHEPEKWAEFCTRYAAELDEKPQLTTFLKVKGGEGPVTLLYSARDTDHNQAVALKSYLDGG